jgi:hypothetical protein
MRVVLVCATILALTAPACAQGMGGGMGGGMRGKGRHGQDQSAQRKPRIDEKAYKAALDRIPEPKGKVDPWGNMR